MDQQSTTGSFSSLKFQKTSHVFLIASKGSKISVAETEMAIESCGDINALTENCIAHCLSLTSPGDACRLALVASTFHSASQSDVVWERFLPSDYRQIISLAVDGQSSLLAEIRSKKDLYFYLCDHPVLINGGCKSFWLEKCTGKKCYMLSARELSIVQRDAPDSWQWVSVSVSRFSEVAQAVDVSWLEIRGKIDTSMLSPGTNYAAYLVFAEKSRTHGYRDRAAEACVGLTGQETGKQHVLLQLSHEDSARRRKERERSRHQDIPGIPLFRRLGPSLLTVMDDNLFRSIEYAQERDDGWMEIKLGEQFITGGEDDMLEMSLVEDRSRVKGRLIFEGIEIRPKECK